MTPEQTSILAHPITVALFTITLTGMGYLISTIVNLIKDNSKLTQVTSEISEILKHVVERQDKTDDALAIIKNDLAELIGEHHAIARASGLIKMHQKKE